jgi:hypothetical protein
VRWIAATGYRIAIQVKMFVALPVLFGFKRWESCASIPGSSGLLTPAFNLEIKGGEVELIGMGFVSARRVRGPGDDQK